MRERCLSCGPIPSLGRRTAICGHVRCHGAASARLARMRYVAGRAAPLRHLSRRSTRQAGDGNPMLPDRAGVARLAGPITERPGRRLQRPPARITGG